MFLSRKVRTIIREDMFDIATILTVQLIVIPFLISATTGDLSSLRYIYYVPAGQSEALILRKPYSMFMLWALHSNCLYVRSTEFSLQYLRRRELFSSVVRGTYCPCAR